MVIKAYVVFAVIFVVSPSSSAATVLCCCVNAATLHNSCLLTRGNYLLLRVDLSILDILLYTIQYQYTTTFKLNINIIP